MLKRKDPWDREVDFQREALRKAYLQIIFNPSSSSLSTSSAVLSSAAPNPSPRAPSSSHTARLLDVLNLLWLETSHALIHVYRAKVSEMDKIIAEAPNAHRGGGGARGHGPGGGTASGGSGGSGRANNIPGPTARRRLIHSFRAFLGQEEEFFRALLSRLAVSLYPSDLAGLRSLGVSIDQGEEANGDNGEDDSFGEAAGLSPEVTAQRRNAAVPLAHKALICFGDLARYRELYNEPGAGNPHAGTQPRPENGGKKGRGKGDGERKTKNWTRAAECYHQARLLLPDNGNPSNQLAVLSQYAGDHVSSTYHYYRALSVRSPFPTARTNLEITYSKSVSKWFADGGGEPEGDEGVKFRAAFVVLQGLYFTKTRYASFLLDSKSLSKYSDEVYMHRLADIPALSARVQELFHISVEQRLLPSDLIVKAIVTGLCALWDARMFRSAARKPQREDSGAFPSANRRSHNGSSDSPTTSSSLNLEPHLVIHVLSLYRHLLEIGSSETAELVASNIAAGVDEANLALNISAVLRRTLPSLRILSKWIIGQIEYISRVESRVESKEKKHRDALAADSSTDRTPDHLVTLTELRAALRDFWHSYTEFANTTQQAFPLDLLPSALDGEVWLEEDVDMLGFAPLRSGMKKEVRPSDGTPAEIARVGKDVHPNEEQLMRIADVQTDARIVAALDTSDIVFLDGIFTSSLSVESDSPEAAEARDVAAATEQLSAAFGLTRTDDFAVGEDEEEDEGEYAITEDDPVDLAMRVATADRMEMDDDEDEDDEEEIVFRPSLSSSQILSHQALPPPLGTAARSLQRGSGDFLLGPIHPNGISSTKASPPVGVRSIWAPTNATSSALPPPANPSEIGLFESLPNTTHQPASTAFSRKPSLSNAGTALPHPTPATTVGLARSPSLFGNFSPFASPSSRPLPLPSSFATSQPSDLSPHANIFAGSPQRNASIPSGWPDAGGFAGSPQRNASVPNGWPDAGGFGRPFPQG
ncbi:hypothetical protein P7C70_g4013, partial [Phenoliferia sp. Uapishka_3]